MQLILLLLLCPLLSFGQQQEPTSQIARVEGQIVDRAEKALPGVIVRLTGPSATVNGFASQPVIFSAESDAAGKFLIDNITPGRNYRLTSHRAGFATSNYGASFIPPNPISLSLGAGQTLSGITMAMTPQCIINGIVRDKNGVGIAGAMVVLMRQGFVAGTKVLQGVTSWGTNDQGLFRIVDVLPGRYYLQVVDRQRMSTATGAYAVSYYPNTTNPRAATPIDIAAGVELRNINIQIQQTPVFSIQGKVVDANNVPLGGITGGVAPVSNPDRLIVAQYSRKQFQTRPDGTFVISGLAPDRYLVQASSGPQGGQIMGLVETSVTDGNVDNVTVALRPAVQLTGSVTFPNGRRIPNLSGVLALLDATNRGLAGFSSGLGPSGTFIARDVLPTRYYLEPRNLPEGMYVEGITASGVDLSQRPLELTSSIRLNLTISDRAADVSGVVRNRQGQSMVGSVVSLWKAESDPAASVGGARTLFADQAGAFRFSNLRPGIYYVAAWDGIDPGLIARHSFLSSFNDVASKLELGESAHATVELTLIPSARIKAEEAKIP